MVARRAAAEALTALLASPALERELEETDLAALFHEVEMPLVPVLARMELAGIAIDSEQLAAMSAEFATELADLEQRIIELVGHPFNIGSPKQLEQVLFKELELPATKRTRTGYSTDASVLEELKDKHEVVALILQHRQWSKLKSHLHRRAAPAGRPQRPGPHHLLPGRGRDRAPVEHRSQPAEHPGAHGAGPSDPAGLRGSSGPAAAGRRLLAGRAADPGPRQRRPRLKAAFAAGEDIHRATAARVLGVDPEASPPSSGASPRWSTSGWPMA